ncbi:MAG TPA: hypothetical protein VMC80_01185 [Patescibacteria group bacterium]|nr:hypothetical protein [Patescibacteria group bacterium]
MLKKEDLPFIEQMIESMMEGEVKLERAYQKKDNNGFDSIKKMMLELQKKISDIVK